MVTSPTARNTAPVGAVDPRTPCLIGWSQHTWPKSATVDAPEPLDMWDLVARSAAASTRAGTDVLARVDSAQIVYTQSWPYDDPVGRLGDRLGMTPRHRIYSGIGGTTPQVLVQDAAAAILGGEIELALVTSAESLDTVRKIRKRGERPAWSFRDPEKKPFPFEAPFIPAEVDHEVFQAWFTFAMFDNARRAHRRVGLDEHRRDLAEGWHRFSQVAARNPEAWFPVERSVDEILHVTPTNRMIGYPYTKYMVAVMDVDMAAALILSSHEKADSLGVPVDQRVYLRGWAYATDPQAVAAHADMWRSPAMEATFGAAFGGAGVGARRRRPPRPLLLLRLVGRLRPRCAGSRRRRPPGAHRHRWPSLLRGSGQRLHDPLHRLDGRRVAGRPGFRRRGDRSGDAHDQARRRRLLDHARTGHAPRPLADPAGARRHPTTRGRGRVRRAGHRGRVLHRPRQGRSRRSGSPWWICPVGRPGPTPGSSTRASWPKPRAKSSSVAPVTLTTDGKVNVARW